MDFIPRTAESKLPTCACGCGRREFLRGGLGAATLALLARPWARAAGRATAGPGGPITNAVPFVARPLPLTAVRLTGGPLKRAQDLGAQNLLKLEGDRLMYHLRLRAGLTPKAASGYGGWDAGGRQLTGHIAGHYLSGVSLMFATTGDPRFKERADYLVAELKAVQDQQGDGYLGALMGTLPAGQAVADGQTVIGGKSYPVTQGAAARRGGQAQYIVDAKPLFRELAEGVIRSGGFDLNGLWSPWYVQHKLTAGLRDAYRHTGNLTALEVSVKFATWVEGLLAPLTPAQIQRMLATEFGGLNESFADLYADTGDPRWLRLSEKFRHDAIVGPLAGHQDILGGKHGNTQVPKLLGELARHIHAGNPADGEAARFFWSVVVEHHSFATGGHGYDEYFGPPDRLAGQVDGTGQRSADLRTCESCNVYNMLKLTRLLFALQPDAKFAEFHERALFNHVLASLNFDDGQVCYMVPVGRNSAHEYQGNDSFTCCVGTGLENHALHADGLYGASADKFWVNLYAPSTVRWEEQGADLAMETDFPTGGAATLRLTLPAPKTFTLALRRPAWAGAGFAVQVNGTPVTDLPAAGGYVEVRRAWRSGDTVALTLPKALWKEPLPDNASLVALMWGPLVLGADLGVRAGGRRGGAAAAAASPPVFVAATGDPVAGWLKPVTEKPGAFHANGVGATNNEVNFLPFYQLSGRRYGIYQDVLTPAEWAARGGQPDAETERRHRLEAATVGYAQPGQMQPERDFNFQGEGATVIAGDTPGRRATGWFSFDLPADPAHPTVLIVTYSTGEARASSFTVAVDGTVVRRETVVPAAPARLYDVEYPLPTDLVRGKSHVTVRFEAVAGGEIGGVYGVRTIRGDAAR